MSALAPIDDADMEQRAPGTELPSVFTPKEVCEMLRCSSVTLRRYVARGLLSPIRLSQRRLLFRASDIERLLTDHLDSDDVVVRGALALLNETHAEEDRELCPSCTKRRVNRGHSMCTRCEESHEMQLQHKRTWWNKHGAERRAAQRKEDVGSGDD